MYPNLELIRHFLPPMAMMIPLALKSYIAKDKRHCHFERSREQQTTEVYSISTSLDVTD